MTPAHPRGPDNFRTAAGLSTCIANRPRAPELRANAMHSLILKN